MKRLVWWSIMLPLTVVVAAFTYFNRGGAPIDVGLWAGSAPVYVLIFASLFVGFFAGGLAAWISFGARRKRARELANRNAALMRQIDELRRERAAAPARIADPNETSRVRLVSGA
jgi:hypothetical protein